MEEIKSINLNTRFANNYGSSRYLSNPTWNLVQPIKNVSSVKLKQFTFPLSIYNIDSRNNKIAFKENGSATVLTLTLTSKNYTGSSLATELASKLNAVGGTNVYTVVYDFVVGTNVLTISVDGANSFDFVDTPNNVYYECGLESKLNNNYGLVTTDPIDLSGVNQIHLVSNVGAIDCINSQYKVLASITTEEELFDVSVYNDDGQDYANCNYSSLNEISLYLYDGRFRLLNPNKDYNLTINFVIDTLT
jgi:hypothetical protein